MEGSAVVTSKPNSNITNITSATEDTARHKAYMRLFFAGVCELKAVILNPMICS